MSLQEQKLKFLATYKAKKAVAFASKWFEDFSSFKLEPSYLQTFYSNEKYGIVVPLSAQNELYDYELMFWFWFYKRYDRLQTENQIAVDNAAYEKEIAEIESNNPLNFLGSLFSEGKNLLLLLGGGLLVYKFLGRKK